MQNLQILLDFKAITHSTRTAKQNLDDVLKPFDDTTWANDQMARL